MSGVLAGADPMCRSRRSYCRLWSGLFGYALVILTIVVVLLVPTFVVLFAEGCGQASRQRVQFGVG
jgi:peptidoglycan biosynthesis protein MviN/MurJ (putative lipid II flippase)